MEVVIVKALRSAIGKYMGMYKDISVANMGKDLVMELTKKIKPEEVIVGNVLSSNLGQNIARQITLLANLDESVNAYTVNMVCGSSMKAIHLAYNSILLGERNIVLAGGIEKMSNSETMLKDGLIDAMNNVHMGLTAEKIAKMYDLKREELDDFAYNSQLKAINAIKNNKFKDEIFDNKQDEYPRFDINRDKMKNLKTPFMENGLISAANSSGINDGGAFLLLMSEEKAIELNLEILGYIKGFSSYANDPMLMGIAPINSIKMLLNKFNLKTEDIDIYEINEAFAATTLACIKDLGLDEKKVNVNGGAISLGHPIGASGARILVSLLHEMKRSKLKYGIASLCIGGGQALSVLIERKN